MIADTSVARALSVLRSGPIFELPAAVKVGPFSFFGAIPDNVTTVQDLRLAAARSDAQLNQIAAGNNPGITLIITAMQLTYDETPNLATPTDYYNCLRQVHLESQKSGTTRFIQLAAFSGSNQSNPTNGNVAQTLSGPTPLGPRMLSVPLVVDMEHDAVFGIATNAPVNMTAAMPFNLLVWGIAFSNSLTFRADTCLDDASAVSIGKTGAAMDTVLTPAFNPDAYR
jgi:hypothetical protein